MIRRLIIRAIPIVAATVLIVLFARLGFWQLHRAADKTQIESGFSARESATPVTLEGYASQPDFQPVTMTGEFIDAPLLLLDNQLLEGQPGVHVFALFEPRAGGPVLLVNRGWRALPDRQVLPTIELLAGQRQLSGRLNAPPGIGVRLGEQVLSDAASQLVTRIDLTEIEQWLNRPVAPQVLLATGSEAFTSDWRPNFMPASRHRGYAFQWFALSTTVLIVTLLLQWRGRKREQ